MVYRDSKYTGIPFFFSSATGVWGLVFFMPSSGGARFLSSPGNLSQLSACSPVGRGWGEASHPRKTHNPENLNHKTAFCVLAGGACACTFFFSSATGVQDFCFSSATGVLGSRFLMPSSGGARFFYPCGPGTQGLSLSLPLPLQVPPLAHARLHATNKYAHVYPNRRLS